MESKVDALHEKVEMLKIKIYLCNPKLNNANYMLKNCRDVFAKSFTKSQLERLTPGQIIRQWTEDDIVNVLSIHSLGLKSYKYIRDHLNFPLPGISTLKE